MKKKNKTLNILAWDDCTPTKDRRPTTAQDVREDVHIEKFDTPEELYKAVLEIVGYDDDEIMDDFISNGEENPTLKEKIEDAIGYLTDPGDGSANILCCKVNGEDCEGAEPYDGLEDYDFENSTEEELQDTIIENDDYIEDDDEEYEITLQDCIDYCEGDEEAGSILYNWLSDEDALYDDPDDVFDVVNIIELCDAASNSEAAKKVRKACGFDFDEDDD